MAVSATVAGVSHGGLFRHFATRTELLTAATHEVGRRHLLNFSAVVSSPDPGTDVVDDMVQFFREATRDPLSAAWREIIVAARTDEVLNDAVRPAVKFFEQAIMTLAANAPDGPENKEEFGTLILSLLHMFDSEATTAAILETEDIQQMRHEWAVTLLRQAYGQSTR